MAKKEQITFEEQVKRLEEIVSLLDSSEITLEESLKLYEEGMELSGILKKFLEKAELKIVEINSKAEKKEEA